jgi:hypothetical protein
VIAIAELAQANRAITMTVIRILDWIWVDSPDIVEQ